MKRTNRRTRIRLLAGLTGALTATVLTVAGCSSSPSASASTSAASSSAPSSFPAAADSPAAPVSPDPVAAALFSPERQWCLPGRRVLHPAGALSRGRREHPGARQRPFPGEISTRL
ncbi:MAG: hypothetical protein ACRDN0_19835, partial [Trebonia sp.]